jgi:hypothetical protein
MISPELPRAHISPRVLLDMGEPRGASASKTPQTPEPDLKILPFLSRVPLSIVRDRAMRPSEKLVASLLNMPAYLHQSSPAFSPSRSTTDLFEEYAELQERGASAHRTGSRAATAAATHTKHASPSTLSSNLLGEVKTDVRSRLGGVDSGFKPKLEYGSLLPLHPLEIQSALSSSLRRGGRTKKAYPDVGKDLGNQAVVQKSEVVRRAALDCSAALVLVHTRNSHSKIVERDSRLEETQLKPPRPVTQADAKLRGASCQTVGNQRFELTEIVCQSQRYDSLLSRISFDLEDDSPSVPQLQQTALEIEVKNIVPIRGETREARLGVEASQERLVKPLTAI